MQPNSSRRSEIHGRLAVTVLWLVAFGAGCSGEALPRPDLVLITVDRLGAEQLACFDGPTGSGNPVCALADSGTRFAATITEGRGEASSAATVLTGLPSENHGVDDSGLTFLGDAQISIAERLSDVGYATAAFVSSPILNHTRRFDQGFGRYIDGNLASADLAVRVERWVEQVPSPRFAWIHLGGGARLPELERLVSRLGALLENGEDGAGVLFVALAGDPAETGEIDWRSHRVPMIWRAPARQRSAAPTPVSRALSSLLDIAPTLASVARVQVPDEPTPEGPGRSLDSASTAASDSSDRFLLVEGLREVGLASGQHLYVRGPSDLDGSGRPLPTSELERHGARFSTLPDAAQTATHRAALSAGPWRVDVLRADSPVPRLEFHLARRLRERAQPAAD